MEHILHLAKSLYMPYQNEIILGILACLFVLMILTLLAVRRCRKQIKRLTENTKEMAKVALSQSSLAMRREKTLDRQEKSAQPDAALDCRGGAVWKRDPGNFSIMPTKAT